MALVGQVMLAMLRVFFMHEIIYIVQMFLLTSHMLMAVIVKVVPTMDMLVTVQAVSMMKILLISC